MIPGGAAFRVEGAGCGVVNGYYRKAHGEHEYCKVDDERTHIKKYTNDQWSLESDGSKYKKFDVSVTPPRAGWEVAHGVAPPPRLLYPDAW